MRTLPFLLVLALAVLGCDRTPRATPPAPPPPRDASVPRDAAVVTARPPDATLDAALDAAPDAASDEAWVEDPIVVACDEACTTYAGCWELVNDGEPFHGGGACSRACVAMAPTDRDAYLEKLTKLGALRREAWRKACRALIPE